MPVNTTFYYYSIAVIISVGTSFPLNIIKVRGIYTHTQHWSITSYKQKVPVLITNCLWWTNIELRAVRKEIKKDCVSRELCQSVHVLSWKIDRVTCWTYKTGNTWVYFSYRLVSYGVLHTFYVRLIYPCCCRNPGLDHWDGNCGSYTQFCYKLLGLVAWGISFSNCHCLWEQVITLPSFSNGWSLLVVVAYEKATYYAWE